MNKIEPTRADRMTKEPTEAQIKEACEALDDKITDIEADMADDAVRAEQTGDRVDLYEYAIEITPEEAKTLRHAIVQRDAERAEHEALKHDLARQMTIANTTLNEYEAFRQRVSEFATNVRSFTKRLAIPGVSLGETNDLFQLAEAFIQPDPEPTPAEVLAEAVKETWWAARSPESLTDALDTYLTGIGFNLAPIKDRSHETG